MKETKLYQPLWRKNSIELTIKLKKALYGPETIILNKSDFEALGNRNSSDYTFNLMIKDAKVTNNISGTAVARDLYDTLVDNPKTKELLLNQHYKLSLGKDYILKISSVE